MHINLAQTRPFQMHPFLMSSPCSCPLLFETQSARMSLLRGICDLNFIPRIYCDGISIQISKLHKKRYCVGIGSLLCNKRKKLHSTKKLWQGAACTSVATFGYIIQSQLDKQSRKTRNIAQNYITHKVRLYQLLNTGLPALTSSTTIVLFPASPKSSLRQWEDEGAVQEMIHKQRKHDLRGRNEKLSSWNSA